MYVAEKSDAAAGPVAYVLGAPTDPLGQIYACAAMYQGVVVRDTADVTDEQRRDVLEQIQRTALKMPLEAVSFHFMLEGVHRGITHQMVRQRTAAYAQESTRFAVKDDLETATALPPSLMGTVSQSEFAAATRQRMVSLGLMVGDDSDAVVVANEAAAGRVSDAQRQRFEWDRAVGLIGSTYRNLIEHGMPAEEARGLMPTNITTRLNYITNLRSFYDTMAVRVSDQAQFEWRMVARAYALALREYGKGVRYRRRATENDPEVAGKDKPGDIITRSSAWQYIAITEQIRPIEFVLGRPAFEASFDRPSRIFERVRAFAQSGVPSSSWLEDDYHYNIPAIHPAEWLLDPDAARLKSDQEFDVFGNRVTRGNAIHWRAGMLWYPDGTPVRLSDLREKSA